MIVATRRERKERTRLAILGAAEALFTRKGLVATRTADIADSAGISHGSVFVHFGTRDELVETVVHRIGGRIVTNLRRLVRAGGGVREVLAAHLASLSEHERFYTRLVREGPFLPPDARRVLVKIQSAISTQLEEALERDAARRRIRKVPADFAFNLWIGLLHHYLLNRDLFAPQGSVIERWGRKLMNQYLQLLDP